MAQRGGLQLELIVPRAHYPRNALMHVYAYARNVSHHTVWIEGGGPMAPGRYLPQVAVLNGQGQSLPLSLTSYFPYPGPAPYPAALKPGQSIGGRENIVLRGSWLRVGVTLLAKPALSAQSAEFHTPVLHVHLLPSDAPAVQVSVTNGEGSATITRPPNVHGFPWSVYYADCGGTGFDERFDWSRASIHFTSGCSPLVAWHVLVGWWGHSVATIDIDPVRRGERVSPLSRVVSRGVSYPYSLNLLCGVGPWVDFDASFWDVPSKSAYLWQASRE
jgi:hypothetical protein